MAPRSSAKVVSRSMRKQSIRGIVPAVWKWVGNLSTAPFILVFAVEFIMMSLVGQGEDAFCRPRLSRTPIVVVSRNNCASDQTVKCDHQHSHHLVIIFRLEMFENPAHNDFVPRMVVLVEKIRLDLLASPITGSFAIVQPTIDKRAKVFGRINALKARKKPAVLCRIVFFQKYSGFGIELLTVLAQRCSPVKRLGFTNLTHTKGRCNQSVTGGLKINRRSEGKKMCRPTWRPESRTARIGNTRLG